MSFSQNILELKPYTIAHEYYISKTYIIGGIGSGRKALLYRYSDDEYRDIGYLRSWETSFKIRTVKVNDKIIKHQVEVWDNSYPRHYTFPSESDLLKFDNIIITCDVTDAEILEKIPDWVTGCRQKAPHIPFILPATKTDSTDRCITPDALQTLAKSLQIETIIETSAKDNVNVDLLFKTCNKLFLKNPPSVSQSDMRANINKEKLKIIRDLDKYIKRIESHSFSYGFWFSSQSRAINREADCLLAKNLQNALKTDTYHSIKEIFSDIDKQRNDIIGKFGLFSKPGYSQRSIEDAELNTIIHSIDKRNG